MDFRINKVKEENEILSFQLEGLNVCFANSLRRTILSDINTIVFKTMPYEESKCTIFHNTTKLNNEILKQRLSCIPIHISDSSFNHENFIMELDEINEDDQIKIITSKHFRIKNKETDKYLSQEETKKIFPPYLGLSNSTEYYIDFVKLLPKISDAIPGNKIKLQCEFSISNARDDSMFNVVSTCSYGNTIDQERVEETIKEKMAMWKQQGKSKEDISFEIDNFKALEAKRIFIPDSFNFIIQSVGVFENKELIKKACLVLENKCIEFLDEVQSGDSKIETSNTTMENCFDIQIKDIFFELGAILNHILYSNYYETDKKILSYVGFKKMHPHDDSAVLRIAFLQSNNGEKTIVQLLEDSSKLIVNTFQKIKKLF